MVKKATSSAISKLRGEARSSSQEEHQFKPQSIPFDLLSPQYQQRLLNIFSAAFQDLLASDRLQSVLQEVKRALYNRDFNAAFAKEEYLQAYAARWSPTRALCYATVFWGLKEYLEELRRPRCEARQAVVPDRAGRQDESDPTSDEPTLTAAGSQATRAQVPPSSQPLKMLSIGGCAAEQLAFASYLHQTSSPGKLTLLDSAPWSGTTSLIQSCITSEPSLSKYASASARASNSALLTSSQLSMRFCQQDVLALPQDPLSNAALFDDAQPLIVTVMFTLNELYTNGGLGRTTAFLNWLGESAPANTLLLIVDSPGNYSEAAVGKEKKRYPMQWLLDHTLLENGTRGLTWQKLESEDSLWFRLPEGLAYPIQLENMRYQMHLYRLGVETGSS